MYCFRRIGRSHQLRCPRLPFCRLVSFIPIPQEVNQHLSHSVPAASIPATMTSGSTVLGVLDVLQQEALKERCILVDEEDRVIGSTTKEDCHRVQSDTKTVKLHRAFSVFLFNGKGEMLIQRRSQHKVIITASHPFEDFILSNLLYNCV